MPNKLNYLAKHINLLMLTQSNQKLQPRTHNQLVKMPPLKQSSPGRLGQLLGKIENTRSTFRSLLSNCARKQPQFDATVGSGDLSAIDFKDDTEKIENSAQAETQHNPSGIASKLIQQINDREIRTPKRLRRIEVKDSKEQKQLRDPPSPKSSPAACGKRAIEPQPDQEGLPSPKQKSTMMMGSLKKRDKQPSQVSPMRKSNLNFDLKNFKKSYNGTFVRIEPEGVEQMIQNKIQQLHPKPNEAVILNIMTPPNQVIKLAPIKTSQLDSIDDQIVKKYVRQNGFLQESSSANAIFEYFNNLVIMLRVNFQSPLIKKYKNCVYFGQNPASGRGQSEGLLYHYKTKLYFGSFKQGKKHGKGCEINFKDNSYCKGQYQNGAKIGVFKVKADDYEYQGEIYDGLFEGKGVLVNKFSKYTGQFVKGYKHGHGQETFFMNGQNYVGNYSYGKFDGTGEITSKNYYYEGQFKDNLKHGQGYEKTMSDEYKGSFVQGKRNGPGILYMSNGDCYSGQFKEGHMYGKGQYQYSDGQRVHGYFVNGRMISERNMPHSKSRRQNNLLDIEENMNDDQFQGINYPETKKDWGRPSDMRQFPREQAVSNGFKTARTPFNPEKLLRLAKPDDRSHYTPQPSFRRFQQERSFNRRGSDLDRPYNQPRGIETQRYHSNQRRRGYEFGAAMGYHPSPYSRPSNNFMQLDYSLFDNSVDDDAPTFPIIPGNRLKSGHTEEPIQKRFG